MNLYHNINSLKEVRKRIRQKTNKPGTGSTTRPRTNQELFRRPLGVFGLTCRYCFKVGHMKRECRSRKYDMENGIFYERAVPRLRYQKGSANRDDSDVHSTAEPEWDQSTADDQDEETTTPISATSNPSTKTTNSSRRNATSPVEGNQTNTTNGTRPEPSDKPPSYADVTSNVPNHPTTPPEHQDSQENGEFEQHYPRIPVSSYE